MLVGDDLLRGSALILMDRRSGKPSADKLRDLRKQLEEKNATAIVVSMLDEIAWLFNLRASDISYNPGMRKFYEPNNTASST